MKNIHLSLKPPIFISISYVVKAEGGNGQSDVSTLVSDTARSALSWPR